MKGWMFVVTFKEGDKPTELAIHDNFFYLLAALVIALIVRRC